MTKTPPEAEMVAAATARQDIVEKVEAAGFAVVMRRPRSDWERYATDCETSKHQSSAMDLLEALELIELPPAPTPPLAAEGV